MGLALSTVLLTGVVAQAQEPFPPEYQRDDEIFFQVTSYEGCHHLDSNPACFQSCARVVLKGSATRVVGRGFHIGQDVDALGALVDPARYVADGIVNEYATLRFQLWNGSGYSTGSYPKQHVTSVKVNGTLLNEVFPVAYGRGSPTETRVKLRVPISLLRFAVRVPGAKPVPQENTIEFLTLVGDENEYVSNECGDHDGYFFGLEKTRAGQPEWEHGRALVTFDAAAPVVMVHGIDSDRNWFTNRGFAAAFDEVRAPYLRAPQRARPSGEKYKTAKGKPGSFSDGPIEGPIQLRLVQEIEWAADEFGVDRVHLVAHSKGGLWSRAAIQRLAERATSEQKVGIYSLTTLDTPHLGSALADFSDYSTNQLKYSGPRLQGILSLWAGDNPYIKDTPSLWFYLLMGQANWNESIPDLRPSEVAGFNAGNALPDNFTVKGRTNRVKYNMLGADANLNGDRDPEAPELGMIYLDEMEGWGAKGLACPILYRGLQLYGSLSWNPDTGALTNVLHLQPPFPGNDFAVSVPSQFFQDPGQTAASKRFAFFRSSPAQPMKKNHTTIGDEDIGELVRGLCRWEFQQ
jgi:pimeloyl-ACP methyl ester carboxylesterase